MGVVAVVARSVGEADRSARMRDAFEHMTFAEHQRAHGGPADLAAWLEMDADIDVEIEPAGLGLEPAEL